MWRQNYRNAATSFNAATIVPFKYPVPKDRIAIGRELIKRGAEQMNFPPNSKPLWVRQLGTQEKTLPYNGYLLKSSACNKKTSPK